MSRRREQQLQCALCFSTLFCACFLQTFCALYSGPPLQFTRTAVTFCLTPPYTLPLHPFRAPPEDVWHLSHCCKCTKQSSGTARMARSCNFCPGDHAGKSLPPSPIPEALCPALEGPRESEAYGYRSQYHIEIASYATELTHACKHGYQAAQICAVLHGQFLIMQINP